MKKTIKISLIVLVSLVGAAVLSVGGYLGYIVLSYYRIGDAPLEIESRADSDRVKTGTTYSISTYNIGFSAYSQDFTFFMDTGYDSEGKATCGHFSKAKSKKEAEFNLSGAIETLQKLDADFILLQEVDVDSTRSFHIDQDQRISDSFPRYDHVFALNFHTAYLPYPLYDMHGSVRAGLSTLSRYTIRSAERKEYTVSTSLSKFFDLDRCFSVSSVSCENGKTLYIINSHMSAYDENGVIRKKQMEELNDFLKQCRDQGDYVIVGGDFNHDLLTYNPEYGYDEEKRPFAMSKKTPDWVSYFFSEDGFSPLTEGYKVVADDSLPTCRNNDIEWIPEETYVCTVDGFIVSENIDVSLRRNVATNGGNKGLDGFAYSDHQPVYLEFSLKA